MRLKDYLNQYPNPQGTPSSKNIPSLIIESDSGELFIVVAVENVITLRGISSKQEIKKRFREIESFKIVRGN